MAIYRAVSVKMTLMALVQIHNNYKSSEHEYNAKQKIH